MADLGPPPDYTNYLALAAPLHGKQVPGMRTPQPEEQPTPGFGQWIANRMPTRESIVDVVSDVLGAPVDGVGMGMRLMGLPVGWKMAHEPFKGHDAVYTSPDVPFDSLWFRNAINNPSLTWDQVRGALQSPSIHSMRGIGSLF